MRQVPMPAERRRRAAQPRHCIDIGYVGCNNENSSCARADVPEPCARQKQSNERMRQVVQMVSLQR